MVRFCKRCGTYIPLEQGSCPKCGGQDRIKRTLQMRQLSPEHLTLQDVLECFPSSPLRPYQKEILESAVEAFSSGKKCVVLAAPTGFGKSFVNAAFTSLTRSFYATPQLALIDQIEREPSLKSRFTEIRGRQNYRCYHQPNRGVNVGRCVTEDYACEERLQVCPYWIQKLRAMNAQSVLTSLAYLISEGQTEDRPETYLGTRTLLVLDESHNLEEQCLNHVSVRLSQFTIPNEIYEQILPGIRDLRDDTQLKDLLRHVEERLIALEERMDSAAQTGSLSVTQAEDLERIAQYLSSYRIYVSSESEWVWQVGSDELLLQPVFAKEFMKQLIWKRGEYYIISSATILDPTEFMEFTGLRDMLGEDKISFLQVPSTFPVENRPIIDATVGPLSWDRIEENMPKAIRAVDSILNGESGNVAIHCHSYGHQKALLEGISEDLKPRLIYHGRRDRERKLEEWMQSRGKVFVSVAFSEGQDWKYDVCDAQILLKVPFPDLSDARVKRRLDLGYRQWYDNQAMMEVIQAYGRAVRAEDDRARFYIVDGSFTTLVRRSRHFIPEWFKEALPTSFLSDRSD